MNDMDVYSTRYSQWWRQFLGMLLCLTCAIVTGLFTGWVVKLIDPITMHDKAYDDGSYWEVAPGYNYRYGIAELEDRPGEYPALPGHYLEALY